MNLWNTPPVIQNAILEAEVAAIEIGVEMVATEAKVSDLRV